MATDTMIRTQGTKILIDALGLQSATRFFTLIQREPFDYTKWQENLMEDMSVKEISDKAAKYRQQAMHTAN
jgi:hypothetical protein